jgi:hypothetical protein
VTVNCSGIGGFDVAEESIATRTKLTDDATKCTTSVVARPSVTAAIVVQFGPSFDTRTRCALGSVTTSHLL